MKLRIKEEFLEWSIKTKSIRTKLKNLPEHKYLELYENGFSDFFEVIKPKKVKVEEPIVEIKIEDIENKD